MTKLIAKLVIKFSKLLGNDGTSIGGKIAWKLDKNILSKLGKKVSTIIVITGTNGKTTTSNLIASCFDEDIIHNGKGANMYFGVISAFIQGSGDVAVLEVDEGSISKVFNDLDVDYFVVTNFFRDQLDRYGEIDMLVDKIKNSISNKTHLILNGDDPFTMRLKKNECSTYGLSKELEIFNDFEISESRYCPQCSEKLVYEKIFYLQMGYYNCSCGFSHPKLDVEVSNVTSTSVTINGKDFKHNLRGNYNAYNLAAAYTVLNLLNIDVTNGFNSYHSNDGRMQVIKLNDIEAIVTLAKNPSGMNMSLSQITDEYKNIVFVLNDNILDGLDISWIWDADFEILNNNHKFFVAGTRKEDMAVRLKYAGIANSNIVIVEDLDSQLDNILTENTFAISSYTSVDNTRKSIEKRLK